MTTADCNGMRADLDGIRALGELSRRQAGHVGNIEAYLRDTCEASGAFKGVMGFFHGTYAAVVSAASQGLNGARGTHERAAQTFDESAATYEAADRGAYDVLARIAGPAGWEIDPYRAVGSGNSRIGLGRWVDAPTDAQLKDPEAAGPGLGDELREDLKAQGVKELKGIPDRLVRETAMFEGRRVFTDTLTKEQQENLDKDWIDRADDRLKKISDPLGVKEDFAEFKKKATKQAVADFHEHGGAVGAWADHGRFLEEQAPNWAGPGLIAEEENLGFGEFNPRNSANQVDLHHNVKEVAGWYDGIPEAKDYVLGFKDDPTGGIGDSVGEFKESWQNAGEVYGAAHEKSDTSALDWGKR